MNLDRTVYLQHQWQRFIGTPGIILLVIALCVSLGCIYDPPPEIRLTEPEGGAYTSGDTLILQFSEPIDSTTLAIRVWSSKRDSEGKLNPEDIPLLEICRLTESPCDNNTLELSTDEMSAELNFDSNGLGRPDLPMILEVIKGLSDKQGRSTGISTWFDIQFIPPLPDTPQEPVPFEEGIYLLVGSIDDPIPALMTYFTEIRATSDNLVVLAGAEADEIEGIARGSTNPAEQQVDTTEEGYTIFSTGQLSMVDGERFLATEPFEVTMFLGPVKVEIKSVNINAKITNTDGHDHLEGTFVFDSVTLTIGDVPYDYNGGSTFLVGNYAPPELELQGVPEICGNLCGGVIGQCNPPDPFPPVGFCDALDD